jgi:2'-5' RNA ligase
VIRAFIAVAIDPRVVDQVATAMSRLKPQIAGVRWVAPDNFHLTLKFLGGIDEAVISPIGDVLRAPLRLFPRFTINVKGLGVFPGPRRPRVLWVGLTGDGLAPLASRVESALQPLGFTPENRKFTPHLTIGRWREALPASASLALELEKWQAHEFGKFTVESVKLMQSVLKPDGASYRDLIEFPLSQNDPSAKRHGEGE